MRCVARGSSACRLEWPWSWFRGSAGGEPFNPQKSSIRSSGCTLTTARFVSFVLQKPNLFRQLWPLRFWTATPCTGPVERDDGPLDVVLGGPLVDLEGVPVLHARGPGGLLGHDRLPDDGRCFHQAASLSSVPPVELAMSRNDWSEALSTSR